MSSDIICLQRQPDDLICNTCFKRVNYLQHLRKQTMVGWTVVNNWSLFARMSVIHTVISSPQPWIMLTLITLTHANGEKAIQNGSASERVKVMTLAAWVSRISFWGNFYLNHLLPTYSYHSQIWNQRRAEKNHGWMVAGHQLIIIRPHVCHIVISSPHLWIMLTFIVHHPAAPNREKAIQNGSAGERVKVTTDHSCHLNFQEDLSEEIYIWYICSLLHTYHPQIWRAKTKSWTSWKNS